MLTNVKNVYRQTLKENAATERKKIGETKEEEYCDRPFSKYVKSDHRKGPGQTRAKQ